ncbi:MULTISPECIES: chemotaxis protein CheW [unclassified Paenibacillus]|uniref:chemotaxis protein CheW n=1 Tax=unclassified Paenibacillus TaxID=185978 RepID=UPI003645726E
MEPTKQVQYIEIGIGKERYALRIDDIHEIIKMQDITVIPHANPYIKGVINLRGKVIAVISLRNRLGCIEEAYSKLTRIVVVNYKESMVGLIVDRVHHVTSFSAIQPPPKTIGELQDSCFTGVGRTEGGLVFILKLGHVLQE